MSDKPKWLWKIYDGETHYVVAHSHQHALEIVVKSFDHDSVDQYRAEFDPSVIDVPMPTLVRCAITNDVKRPDYVPKSSQLYAEASAKEWCDSMEPGIATTTCQ